MSTAEKSCGGAGSAQDNLLRSLPQVDETLRLLLREFQKTPRMVLKDAVRQEIDALRGRILTGAVTALDHARLYDAIRTRIRTDSLPHLCTVINATGVVLHTNLGRARLPEEAVRSIAEVSAGYANLEYSLGSGRRGRRCEHVEQLLCRLTGAEAALVVNNNAAAVFLALNTLANGREVVVSRGELVEIGDSFRIPEIMSASGCRLVEVGTTNKTTGRDYRTAISEQTGALMKVHTSNYRIRGFTQDVSLAELRRIACSHGLPLIYDLGSGLLMSLNEWGLGDEPTVAGSLPHVDVLCFSGDKLLGGPQSGIILGKQPLIARMKKNQLLRILRVDKSTLAALEATLRLYLDGAGALHTVPVLRMLTTGAEVIRTRALALAERLNGIPALECTVEADESAVGGGALPDVRLPTWTIAIRGKRSLARDIERRLRLHTIPIIARIQQERVLLDLRTVEESEEAEILNCLLNYQA